MPDSKQLIKHWVEVREESADGRIVLRPFDSPLPPARGRRGLVIGKGEVAEARSPGMDDRSVRTPGSWSLDGDILTVSAPGWSGKYRLEELTEERLVLSPE